MVCLERPKINEKEAEARQDLIKRTSSAIRGAVVHYLHRALWKEKRKHSTLEKGPHFLGMAGNSFLEAWFWIKQCPEREQTRGLWIVRLKLIVYHLSPPWYINCHQFESNTYIQFIKLVILGPFFCLLVFLIQPTVGKWKITMSWFELWASGDGGTTPPPGPTILQSFCSIEKAKKTSNGPANEQWKLRACAMGDFEADYLMLVTHSS